MEAVEASWCMFLKKLVDETQMPHTQVIRTTFKQILADIFLSVRVNSKRTFQCEIPCSTSLLHVSYMKKNTLLWKKFNVSRCFFFYVDIWNQEMKSSSHICNLIWYIPGVGLHFAWFKRWKSWIYTRYFNLQWVIIESKTPSSIAI